jgi:hypothetical protein
MVLGDVPRSERCRCREVPRRTNAPTASTAGGPKNSTKNGSKSASVAPAPDTAIGRFKAWLRQ